MHKARANKLIIIGFIGLVMILFGFVTRFHWIGFAGFLLFMAPIVLFLIWLAWSIFSSVILDKNK